MTLPRRNKNSRPKKASRKTKASISNSSFPILQQPAAILARRPKTYEELLAQLKLRSSAAQIHSALQVNSELIFLYWQIGCDIIASQRREGWGANVIERLAADLHRAFPAMRGFSLRNLGYMKSFAEAYTDAAFLQPASAGCKIDSL